MNRIQGRAAIRGGLASLVLLGALSLGISQGALGAEEVIWWDYSGGGDGVRLKALHQKFNEEHAGEISINATTLEWGVPYYSKLQTSSAVGSASDVAFYHVSRVATGVATNVLTEITDEDLATAGLSKADFDPALLEAVTVDGKLYGVPFDLYPIVLFYNEDKLRAAGLLGEDGRPAGLDGSANFTTAVQKLADGGSNPPVSYYTGNANFVWWLFFSLFSQNDGQVLLDGQVFPGDNYDKAVATLEMIKGWMDAGVIQPYVEPGVGFGQFATGQSAMMISGTWELPTLVDLKAKGDLTFNFGAVVLPTFGSKPATWFDGGVFVIPNNVGNPMTAEKKAAVLEVIGWFVKNTLVWAEGGGFPIPYLPLRDQVSGLEPQAYFTMIPDLLASATFEPPSTLFGPGGPILDAAGETLLPSVNGEIGAAEAIDGLRTRLQELQDQL